MLINQFTDLTKEEVSAEDFEIINTIYAYHPSIPDVDGHPVIASLYKIGGMGLMREMLPVANHAMALEEAIQEAKINLEKAQTHLTRALQDHAAFLTPYKI